jgi:hypothetical protein
VLTRSFSQAAIEAAEDLCVEKTEKLCAALERRMEASESADMNYAFRCMSIDIICSFCFGKSIDALDTPGFQAPILAAMDASLPVFSFFQYSSLFKNMILNCPPALSKMISPLTAGLVDLQQVCLLPSLNYLVYLRSSLTIP